MNFWIQKIDMKLKQNLILLNILNIFDKLVIKTAIKNTGTAIQLLWYKY